MARRISDIKKDLEAQYKQFMQDIRLSAGKGATKSKQAANKTTGMIRAEKSTRKISELSKELRDFPRLPKSTVQRSNTINTEVAEKVRLPDVKVTGFRPTLIPMDKVKGESDGKNYNVGVSKGGVSFREAFAHFRKKGVKEFTWNGKRYHTRTKEEEAKRKEGAKRGSKTDSFASSKRQRRRSGKVGT